MSLSSIGTIVVVIMENRSFDHALGYLSLPGTPARLGVEGLGDAEWLDRHANLFEGARYPIHHIDGTAAGAAANSRAMWAAARKLAADHPDLLAHPSWSALKRRIAP
jgi:hypothetical protein